MSSVSKTCWFIIHKQEYFLFTKHHTLLDETDILSIKVYLMREFSLGFLGGVEYFCAEVDGDIHLNDDFQILSLKQCLSMIDPAQYAMGVKAYSALHWDKNHQFCGRCASPTVQKKPDFQRFCPICNLSFFPRISPSIIVLIHRGDELLMARSPHFPPGVYALIAGFVEIGESLEETIHREVQEEVGLRVKNIVYFGSQPWPFPDSLMLAFTAEYDSGELVIDNQEIEDAGWYHYDHLPGRPSMPMSIGSQLIDDFVRQRSHVSCVQDKYGQ